MLNAARAHGMPMIVMAMMMEATTQPTAIQSPPNTIQATLSRSDRGDMSGLLAARDCACAKGGHTCRTGQYAGRPVLADFLCRGCLNSTRAALGGLARASFARVACG